MSRFPAIPQECEECTLDDCEDTNPSCNLLRKKLAEKGLPEKRRVGRPQEYVGIVPTIFEDMKDYRRQYARKYSMRFRKITVRVKLRRCDLEALQAICEKENKKLEDEVGALLEAMAEKARGGQ